MCLPIICLASSLRFERLTQCLFVNSPQNVQKVQRNLAHIALHTAPALAAYSRSSLNSSQPYTILPVYFNTTMLACLNFDDLVFGIFR